MVNACSQIGAYPIRRYSHGIEATERVGLGGEVLCAGDGLDISDHDCLSLGQGAPGILCAIGITGLQDDPMSQPSSSHSPMRDWSSMRIDGSRRSVPSISPALRWKIAPLLWKAPPPSRRHAPIVVAHQSCFILLFHVADDGLPAIVHMDVLDADKLLPTIT